MRFSLFLGCTVPARCRQYEISSRIVLEEIFQVNLLVNDQFNCCGYPIRNIDWKSFVLSSARNLALAEQEKSDLLVLCKCCYGSLKKAAQILKQDPILKKDINRILEQEGLQYEGQIRIKHLLTVLFQDIGLARIKKNIHHPFRNLQIATHYGCHLLRPSDLVQFDDPIKPTIFDQLVEATGANSLPWPRQLECCGAPLLGIDDKLSLDLTEKKLRDAQKAGANYLCTGCPYCHLQMDTVQRRIHSERGAYYGLPPILYPQLLALSLGVSGKRLGLDMNNLSLREIMDFLT